MAGNNSYTFLFSTDDMELKISKDIVGKIPYLSKLVLNSKANDKNQYELSEDIQYNYFNYILEYVESGSNDLSDLFLLLSKPNSILILIDLYAYLSLPSPELVSSLSDLFLILDEQKEGAEFLFNLSMGKYDLLQERDELHNCIQYLLTHGRIYDSRWCYYTRVIVEEKCQQILSNNIKNLIKSLKEEEDEEAKKQRSYSDPESEPRHPSFIRPSPDNFYTHQYHHYLNEFDEPDCNDSYAEECHLAWERNDYGNGRNMYWDGESDEWCELP